MSGHLAFASVRAPAGRKRSAQQIAAALQAGMLDAQELLEETLAAIANCGDRAIYTMLTPGRARAEAAAAARRLAAGRPAGPLDGVPVAWADLFDLRGYVTTSGSIAAAGRDPAEADAEVVRRLCAGGMVCTGRVNIAEFIFSSLGLNPHYGTPVNPWSGSVARIPGGGAGGAAVAVARGLVPVAVSTEIGGSARVPAAFNGIVGYQASRGRYPLTGAFCQSNILDRIGILCGTVADVVLTDAALRGHVAPTIAARPVAGQLIMVPDRVVCDNAHPDVLTAFEAAIGRLSAAGARIEQRAMPALARVLSVQTEHGSLATAESYGRYYRHLSRSEIARMDPRLVHRLEIGALISLADYLTLIDTREQLMAEMEAEIGDALVAYPTVPQVAPRLAPLLEDDVEFHAANILMLRNARLGTFLGWCGLSLPCGFGADSMPVGLSLSACAGRDEHLLGFSLSAASIIAGGGATRPG